MDVSGTKIKQIQMDGKWLIKWIRGDQSGLESNVPLDARITATTMVGDNLCLVIYSESFEDIGQVPELVVEYKEKEQETELESESGDI